MHPVLRRLQLREAHRQRLEPLLARGWFLPGNEHPLGRLQGRSLGRYRLLALLGPKNSVGARYFQLLLAHPQASLSRQPLVLGLHSSGPFPSHNWIDVIRYQAAPSFNPSTSSGGGPSPVGAHGASGGGSGQGDEALDLAARRLDRRLFSLLSALLPPGGHLMVEYESPTQRETERILSLGYPAVATPLGYLLFQAGCRSFRDWYIPEGGREGPRKLQGFKPLDEAVAAEKTAQLRRQLSALLAQPPAPQHGQWGRRARRLARAVLRALQREQGTGNKERGLAPPLVP